MQILLRNEFTYGEIDFLHIIPALQLTTPQPHEVFWDLGCGAGKCMAAMALLYPQLSSVNGVEYLPALYSLCSNTLLRLQECGEHAPVNVLQGDLLDEDWSDADIVYVSSVCFPEELIDRIVAKMASLKEGARVLALTCLPPCDHLTQRHCLRVKMTWGKTGIYVYEVLHRP
jgi:precorrin-6B methylase 2